MTEPDPLGPTPSPPLALPKWARVTSFVGLYALVLAGMVALEQSIQDFMAWTGIADGGLERIGLLTGIYTKAR